jgi:diphthamide synthase subunit DPH2
MNTRSLRGGGRRDDAGGVEELVTGSCAFAFLVLAFLCFGDCRSSSKLVQTRALLFVGHECFEFLRRMSSNPLLFTFGRLVCDAELLEQPLQVSSVYGRVVSSWPYDKSFPMGDRLASKISGGEKRWFRSA